MEKPFSPGNKRMLGIQILDIFSRYSSKKSPLTHKQIIDKLNSQYHVTCTRSTLAAHITNFQTTEFHNIFGCIVKCDKPGKGYYLEQEFSDGELKLLIDSVMSIRSLPANDAKVLIGKLLRHGSQSFQLRTKSYTSADMRGLPHSPNQEVLASITVITDAINNNHKVSFIYNDIALNSNKELVLHPRSKERYFVNPYRIMLYSGRLYLLCNTDPHENLSTYRIDKMSLVREEPSSIKTWRDIDKAYNPPKTMLESLHMFSSDIIDIEFWIEEDCLKDVVDWFGWGYFKIDDKKDTRLLIRLKCNETAMLFWALSFGEYIEITKPKELRFRIRELAQEIYKKHKI